MAYYDTIQGTEEFLEAGQMFQSMTTDIIFPISVYTITPSWCNSVPQYDLLEGVVSMMVIGVVGVNSGGISSSD